MAHQMTITLTDAEYAALAQEAKKAVNLLSTFFTSYLPGMSNPLYH